MTSPSLPFHAQSRPRHPHPIQHLHTPLFFPFNLPYQDRTHAHNGRFTCRVSTPHTLSMFNTNIYTNRCYYCRNKRAGLQYEADGTSQAMKPGCSFTRLWSRIQERDTKAVGTSSPCTSFLRVLDVVSDETMFSFTSHLFITSPTFPTLFPMKQ